MNETAAAYEAAVSYLNETPRFTRKHTLEQTGQMLRMLDDPQEKFRVIHVAGSNGKGSVCAMTDAILRSAGMKSGLFTSPHLVTARERFVVDGKMVTEEEFTEDFREVAGMLKAHPQMDHPTYFEYLFLMAMLHFRKAEVQTAVLETGLGGRLDATNAVKNPAVTVITSISLEHTEYLGDTVAQIASEKAGIIKPGVPVVFDGSDPEAAAVIRAAAAERGAPAYEIRREMTGAIRRTESGISFSYDGPCGVCHLQVPSQASYQVMNAALAACAAELFLKDDRYALSPARIRAAVVDGIAHTHFPGRMEEKADGIILDGAHNPAGIEAFLQSVRAVTDGRQVLLFACMDDKNYEDMVRRIASGGLWETIIVTAVSSPRAADPRKLTELFRTYTDTRVLCIPDPAEALDAARACRGSGRHIFAAGSLYLIGELESRL